MKDRLNIQEVLKEHKTWLETGGKEGSRANLARANLDGASLDGANLYRANLDGANLYGASLDFSAWPLHCGSFGALADDRLVAQLLAHVVRLDISKCSGGVQEAVEHIRGMAISDLFCEYRFDVRRIRDREED